MRPESEEELAELLKAAQGPVQIRGGGTQGVRFPVPGAVLETGGLSGVRLYEPGALTLVVGSGMPLEDVEVLLAEKGQRLAFEPRDARVLSGCGGRATIGGVMAANLSGPRRVQSGAARDFLLGLRFVDGAGRIVSNGGRVMKNVTGYDLGRLLAGSRGSLGVITEVSLKVLASPQAEATLVLRGQDPAPALADLCAALATPWEVTGAAWLEGREGPERRLRIEGLPESVAYRAERLAAALPGDPSLVQGEESAALWRELRDVAPFGGRGEPVWRICVKPTQAAGLLARLKGLGLAHRAICDWAGGLIWLMCEGDAARADLLRPEVAALGGHATLIRAGVETVPMLQPQAPGVERLSARLRARFDPRGILNPGLTGPVPVAA